MARFIQKQVKEIYRRRAKRYFWTHLLTTLGHCHFKWRPLLAKLILADLPKVTGQYRVLDLCTGWGLSLVAIWKKFQKNFSIYPFPVLIGLDMSLEMITQGRKHWLVKSLERRLLYVAGLAQNIPFRDNSFHAVMIMLGIGGIPSRTHEEVVREILRVLKPGGKIFILDVTQTPKKTLWQKFFYWPLKLVNKSVTEPYVLKFWGWMSVQGLEKTIQTATHNDDFFNLLPGYPKVYSEPLYPFAHVQIIGAEKVFK